MKAIAKRLEAKGVEITSRWLYKTTGRLENAFGDIRDLREADVLVRFTDNAENTPKKVIDGKDWVPAKFISCARMVEFGIAWERGMPIFVVGGKQNIFDELPNITHVSSLYELKERLGLDTH